MAMPEWFKKKKKRGYIHIDRPVRESFVRKIEKPPYVAKHFFSPLLHYIDVKIVGGKKKKRPIRFACHRDAGIYSYYADHLNEALEEYYEQNGISENVIAYRPLEKMNAHFSQEAFSYAKSKGQVTILAFDVTGFFENLDHGLLKKRLKLVCGLESTPGTPTLPKDWFNVFRSVTRFHYFDLEALKKHPEFAARFTKRDYGRAATMAKMKKAGIKIHPNPEIKEDRKCGIPQGTPISAAMSNLYMVDFDVAARTYCDEIGALYRRYSDDILVVCEPQYADEAEKKIMELIVAEKLEIKEKKTERTEFDLHSAPAPRDSKAAQYLGFDLDESGPSIRHRSLARQWQRLNYAIDKARCEGIKKIKSGEWDRVHTKRLYRRFTTIKIAQEGGKIYAPRSFPSYARRSAKIFGKGEKISGQVKRLERAAHKKIAELKNLSKLMQKPTESK